MKTPMLRSSLVAALMLAFSGIASAAGLGRINVYSALGQPLRAEVEIAATPEDLETMVAKIATPEAFRRANIEYVGALSGVKMTIEKRAGNNAVVRVTSDRPFSEPFVDMLIELNWAGGRLLREYTFLLDPADTVGSKPIASVAEPAARMIPDGPRETVRTPTAFRPVVIPAPRAADDGSYAVRSGDTLNKIATDLKPVEVTQDQMVAALYRANSSAFIGGNINRLRAGRILRVPGSEDAKQIAPGEARRIIIRASNFDQYRQNVAAAAATSQAKESTAGQAASGKIAPKIEEPAVTAQPNKDRVKVTPTQKTADAGGAEAGSQARVQALQDELASRDKSLKEANSRVADLEKNVQELQKLIELKNQGLADAQKQAATADAVAKEAKSHADELAKAKASEPVPLPVAAVSPPVPAESVVAPAASVPEQSKLTPVEVSSPVAQSTPQPAQSVAAPAPAAEDEGFLGNPLAWLGIALAALGTAYVVIKQRRRSQVVATTQLSEVSTTSPNSVFGSAGGQTVDTGGTSLLHTDFSQSGLSAIDADEGVDPVAEADVYMAYGRDAQAEEILLDALKNDPTRSAIYLKLLEIYAQRRSVKQFENIASDLYAQTGGEGEDWAKAAALGARIDPENPLYRQSGSKDAESPKQEHLGVAAAAAAIAPAVTAAESLPELPAEAPAVSFGTNNASQMRSTWTVPGEISQFIAGETAENAQKPIETSAPESSSDGLNLDFNLDLELSDNEEQPTEVEQREVLVPPSAQTQENTPIEPVVAHAAPIEESIESSLPLEFDLGLDDIAHSPSAPAPSSGVDRAASFGVPEDRDLDLEIEPAASDSLAVVDLEKTNFEGNLLDFDFELGEEPPKPALDLSDLNLKATSITGEPLESPSLEAEEPIQDNIDVDDEISTKLELARAYEEMGDMEGARELLEEVIADGSNSQQDAARAILARVG
jgi:pilus assembly protein FimV